jgi:hypothetical protein
LGTFLSDDESQRLTYVIDRLLPNDSITNEFDNYQLLTGELLIPIQCDNKNSSTLRNRIQDGMKVQIILL